MQRGNVMFNHEVTVVDAEKKEYEHVFIARHKNVSYTVSLDEFIDGFLIPQKELESVEDPKERFKLFDEFMRESGSLPDPYNPEHSKELLDFLETKGGDEVSNTEPSHHTEISVIWDEEKKVFTQNLRGIDEEIIQALHAFLDRDGRADALFKIAIQERIGRDMELQQMAMKSQGDA